MMPLYNVNEKTNRINFQYIGTCRITPQTCKYFLVRRQNRKLRKYFIKIFNTKLKQTCCFVNWSRFRLSCFPAFFCNSSKEFESIQSFRGKKILHVFHNMMLLFEYTISFLFILAEIKYFLFRRKRNSVVGKGHDM